MNKEKRESSLSFSEDASITLEVIQSRLKTPGDLQVKKMYNSTLKKHGIVLHLDAMCEIAAIQEHLIKPFQLHSAQLPNTLEHAAEQMMSAVCMKVVTDMNELLQNLFIGQVILLIDGYPAAVAFDLKKPIMRSASPAISESTIYGPHVGFNEVLLNNYVLIRQRIHSEQLQTFDYTIGRTSQTMVRVVCLADRVDTDALDWVKDKLSNIHTDSLLNSQQLVNLMDPNTKFVFPTIRMSERPDSTVSAIVDGKIALLVNGTPQAILGPVTLFDFFVASDDAYLPSPIGIMIRYIRYMCFFITLFLIGIYVALTSFHQELLPLPLLISIAGQRDAVPFPAVIEIFLLAILFDIVQEASIRLPSSISGAVSIIGALVIGQSAVEAQIVSASAVIIIALTGLSGFVFQSFNFIAPLRLFRYLNLLAASVLGGPGLMGMFVIELF
ncbi:MAG: spore germination protein, partial [Bacilli bacterium]